MPRPLLEVADIFRIHGPGYREKNALSPEQSRVMRAIEMCRTAALGGHVDRCNKCGHQVISYNSCRNRHCPKCQSLAKAQWFLARRDETLPVQYYHVVFTIPDLLTPLALQNKQTIYDLLFRTASQALLRIAAKPKHLGAHIGFLVILHTWGQNLMHHPHLHCIVPGGGLSPDHKQWISCRKGFFLPVRVLSRFYRRLFLKVLQNLYREGKLEFYGNLQPLSEPKNFEQLLKSAQSTEWVVYAKPPFAGPEKVLDYLSRYTHRVAISNHRLRHLDNDQVSFQWRDYRNGNTKRMMTLKAEEFIRRFLFHVLPEGYVRIRYYGFLANCHRSRMLKLIRTLLNVEQPPENKSPETTDWAVLFQSLTGIDPLLCPKCRKGRLVTIEFLPPLLTPYVSLRAPPGVGIS